MLTSHDAYAADRLVPSQYPTIQAALNAAVSGDSVLVAPGVYNTGFSFGGKRVVVRSTAGSLVTVIDLSGPGGTVVFAQNAEPSGTRIEGLSIRAATAPAIMVSVGANLDIVNCRITDSTTSSASGGGGLFVGGGTVSVSGSLFQNLKAVGSLMRSVGGGAVAIAGGSVATFVDCQFVSCAASQQFAANGSQVGTWSACGGAVWCSGGSLSLTRCQFSNCSAIMERSHGVECYNVGRTGASEAFGGAVMVEGGGTCDMNACQFTLCQARTANGVQRWSGQYDASQQLQAAHSYGGAIAVVAGARLASTGSQFSDCSTHAKVNAIPCGTGAIYQGRTSRRSYGGTVFVDGTGGSVSLNSNGDSILRGSCVLEGTPYDFQFGGSGFMILPYGSQATIQSARITACSDQALRIGAGTSVSLLGSTFVDSASTSVFLDGNTPIIASCAFKSGAGTPLVTVNTATGPTIIGTTFCGNASNSLTGPWVDGGGNLFWATCPACSADLDNDGSVSGADLGLLIGSWGPCAVGCRADLNEDGAVSGSDLGILLGVWGPCS
jgi:hypothetical protein